jgi:hypothetical protein
MNFGSSKQLPHKPKVCGDEDEAMIDSEEDETMMDKE